MTDEHTPVGTGHSFFERPVSSLATYYFFASFRTGPFFLIAFLISMCKYWTLRYSFDDEGIAMKWGVLWRREIHLTYRRIQDIHLTRNVVQRWMGLANVSVQTAGASATPEMVIEGAPDPDSLRDVLYARMRGASTVPGNPTKNMEVGRTERDPAAAEAVVLLTEIRDLLKERSV